MEATERIQECGDTVVCQVSLGRGRIRRAVFQVFGCGTLHDAGRLISLSVKGKAPEEALRLTHASIVKELGVPPTRSHCVRGALTAFRRALEGKMTSNSQIVS